MSDSRFRPYVEGLRALAIVLVLLFHAGLPVTGGYIGVDVFFVISGFLITGLLLREVENTGQISLLNFYARRAKRLLPASSVVLVFTALGVGWFAPASKQVEFGWDIASAAAYFANFRFAERSVDYLAEDVGRSPVLHFWSLAVEEHFYFVWPLLLLCGFKLAKRMGWSMRTCAAGLLLLVFVPSLTWSIVHTKADPSSSFFVTPTRLWELALGALLAVGLPWVERVPQRFASALAAAGWLLILSAVGLFDAKSLWPSAGALVPTLGTVLLIASGSLDPNTRLLRPLISRPAVALGGLSYSLYLWHWPFVVIGMDFLGFEGWKSGIVLVLLSTIPAFVCHRFVENRFRFSTTLTQSPLQTLSMGFNFSLLALLAGLVFPLRKDEGKGLRRTEITLRSKPGRVMAEPPDVGAGALAKANAKSHERWDKERLKNVSPDPKTASKDVPSAYPKHCQAYANSSEVRWCPIGDDRGKVDVALVGDSKILQYFDAMDATGKALGWKIKTATMSSCPFSAASVQSNGKKYTQCDEFNERVMAELLAHPPEIVITSQGFSEGLLDKDDEAKSYSVKGMARGLVEYWSQLERRGTHVIAVLDNPHPRKGRSVFDCVLAHEGKFDKCSFSLKSGRKTSGAPAQLLAAELFPKVNVVDLAKYICPFDKCSPVIEGTLVYRQTSHITNTYAKTMGPILTEELEKAAIKADPALVLNAN